MSTGLPRDKIGPYRLVRLIGKGGMGAVYEAIQEPIERRVAIKVLHGRYAQEPEIAQRFFNEARAVNIVDHPGIVQISDYGQLPSGVAYLVMEFLKGDTLGQRLKANGGKLAVPEVVRISRQIAAALAAAHEKGVIHRDLKPDNIMLIADPDPEAPGRIRVKLLDFGIAKVAAELNQGAAQTAADVVMGTPKYMAPEQCRGAGNVDDKSDVYSLGVIMYEMLVGKPPFTGAQGEILAKQIYDEPPPIREAAPHVPVNLGQVVHRLLIKNKADRPTMRQVAGELEGLAVAYPTTAHAIVRMPPGFQLSSANIPIPGFVQPGQASPSPQAASGAMVPAAQSSPGDDDTPTGNRLKVAKEKADKDSNSGLRQSTLAGATGQSSASMTPARRRRWIAAVAAATIVVSSLVVAITVRFLRDEREGNQPAVVQTKIERRNVMLSVESTPAGADVLLASSGRSIGLTPMKKDWPRGKEPLKLIIRRPNYKDQTVDANVGSDVSLNVPLEPVDPPKPATGSKPAPTPPAGKNGGATKSTGPAAGKTGPSGKVPAGTSPAGKSVAVKNPIPPTGTTKAGPGKTTPVAGGKPTGKTKPSGRPEIVD
ncbi:MAG TPA: protein kinase [Pseudomonadota bacterium]|nr:protein kinase [Pseudomonadota bacterium]HNN51511.1 protein kinase [Pseudomonadota bacterium]